MNKFQPRTEQFSRFTIEDGLANNVIYGVLADRNKNLWMSTNKGLSRFNTYDNSFTNYEEKDGLQSNEFNIGAYHKNLKGELYFGGINGFNMLNPRQIAHNPNPPVVVIIDLHVNNDRVKPGPKSILKEDVSFTSEISLNYNQRNITLDFAALHYSFSEKNKYAYKMVGVDEDWIYVTERRFANYSNIPAGEYEFIVKGSNADGVWSEDVASLKIKIVPPYWATMWFRALCVLGFLGIVYAVYRIRLKSINDQKIYLEGEIQRRTTEIRAQKDKIENQKEELEIEKDKSEKLLLNILPSETVEELKSKGKARARQYRMASVMFTDFKGFTQIAEDLKPQELVQELDNYFIKFDEIIEKHDIEKIKTIGDAYMCAGGVPIRNKTSPIDVVLAALKIQEYMGELAEEKAGEKEEAWELRIGIHTGELTAGVIGRKRFAYDIWGDSVNVANRMETACEPGKVNISGKTYSHIKEFFQCTYRGKIQAKNKGEIDMYFVDGILPELSIDHKGIDPNKMFYEYVYLKIYSSLNYRRAEKYIIGRLESELDPDLTYHNMRHTKDVCQQVERIAIEEGIKGEDLFLLKTAALYHDAGFVTEYINNEPIGAQMARDTLLKFGYSTEQIEVVANLILATRVPQAPTTHLEEILCDADLDYLGRDDFDPISEGLMNEFTAHGIVKNEKHWDEIQIGFLGAHQYFTSSSRKKRSKMKKMQLENIKRRYADDKYSVDKEA